MAVLTKFGVPAGTSSETLMPKLQYRFRVLFQDIGGPNNGDELLVLTRQVMSVTRPSLQHDEMQVDVYNSKIYLAGKHTWDPITITFRDDVSSAVIKRIDDQLQRQINHATQSAATAGSQYKFQMRIETLDGSDTPGILDFWTLEGCYVSNVAYGESNYATSDQQAVTLTVRYDNAQHGAGDTNFLATSPNRDGSVDLATDQ